MPLTAAIYSLYSFQPDLVLTRREIAKRLGYSKHPGLIVAVEALVSDGVLVREERMYGRVRFFVYSAGRNLYIQERLPL